MSKNRYICVFDTETTGLDLKHDRVISLALIMEHDVSNPYYALFNTRKKISEEASRINGLSNEMLKDKPSFKECAEQILHFLTRPFLDNPGQNVEVVLKAHNNDFDTILLSLEMDRYAQALGASDFNTWFESKFPNIPVVDEHAKGLRKYFILEDTMVVSAYLFGKEAGFSASQDWLAKRLDIDRGSRDTRHDALEDAQILLRCCQKMHEIMGTNLFAEHIGKYNNQYVAPIQITPVDPQRATTIPVFKFTP